MTNELTDEQCNEFRRLPCSFNNMVRAIFKAGQSAEREAIVQYIIDQGTIDYHGKDTVYFINDLDIEAINARGQA